MSVHRRWTLRAPGLAWAGLAWAGAVISGCDDPGASLATPADTVVARPVTAIGELAGAEEYLFGEIGSVALDAEGRIYVADHQTSEIRVYDEDGAFLRAIGREGEGPGEYGHPSDLLFDDSGRLWVRDIRRATVLAPREPGAVPDSVVETRAFVGYTNWTETSRSRVVDGVYYYPDYLFGRDEPARFFYIGYGPSGPTGDTLRVPQHETIGGNQTASYMITANSGRMVPGLSRAPFEPAASWTLTSRGTIVGGPGDAPLVETDRLGDTLRVLDVPPARAVGGQERADSAAALRARIDSLPVPLSDVRNVSQLVRDGDLPDSVPRVLDVYASESAEIWVRRWPPEGRAHESFFDVFDESGERTRTVVVPAELLLEPPPFIGDELLVGVVRDPVTEVQRVVVFRH